MQVGIVSCQLYFVVHEVLIGSENPKDCFESVNILIFAKNGYLIT